LSVFPNILYGFLINTTITFLQCKYVRKKHLTATCVVISLDEGHAHDNMILALSHSVTSHSESKWTFVLYTVKPVAATQGKHKMWLLKAGGCLTEVNISTNLTFGNILFGCLRWDLCNGFTYLQLWRDFINRFLFKYMPF